MKVRKEGLNTYCVNEQVKNVYFLSVEYQVLRCNCPESLLPMHLREQDGHRILLYDITGAKNVSMIAESGKEFSLQDCSDMLESLLLLLQEMEDLMLELEHISFVPEQIYRNANGMFQWMYLPDETSDVAKDVEEYFSWMLSKIDYGDPETVRFVYHVYWCMRNKGLSEKIIRECLEQRQEKVFSYQKNLEQNKCDEYVEKENISYNVEECNSVNIAEKSQSPMEDISQKYDWDYMREKSSNCNWNRMEGKSPNYNWDRMESKSPNYNWNYAEEKSPNHSGNYMEDNSLNDKKEKIFWFLEILCILLSGGVFCSFVIFFIAGLQQGFPMACVRFLVGFGIVFLLLLDGVYQLHHKRKELKEEKSARSADNICNRDVGGMSKTADRKLKQIPVENYTWEEEEGTVILSARKNLFHPVLKCLETGEIHFLRIFPFYIGSEYGINQLILKDKTVSRQHAVILKGKKTGTYMLQDLQSTNGTWLKDKEVFWDEPLQLEHGDIIRLSGNEYQFLLMQGEKL